jgi:hypothetical protein
VNDLKLTFHARQRMQERDIDLADINAVLASPSRTTTPRTGATNHHGLALDGRAIVVVTADDMPDLIITVMPDDSEPA